MKLLGISKLRTTAYHPASNGMIERMHRSLKAALMCHAPQNWTKALPSVLLGLRSTIKEDLGCTPAQLLYGTTLRLPGDFFEHGVQKPSVNMSEYVTHIRDTIQQTSRSLRSVRHGTVNTYVPKELSTCRFVFLRTDAVKQSLQPPYEGPFAVVKRDDKLITIVVNGKEKTVNMDRVKPAWVEESDQQTTLQPQPSTSQAQQSTSQTQQSTSQTQKSASRFQIRDEQLPASSKDPVTTRSGRQVVPPKRLSYAAVARGGVL